MLSSTFVIHFKALDCAESARDNKFEEEIPDASVNSLLVRSLSTMLHLVSMKVLRSMLLLPITGGGAVTEVLNGAIVGSAVPSSEIEEKMDGAIVDRVEFLAAGAGTAPGAEDGTFSG